MNGCSQSSQKSQKGKEVILTFHRQKILAINKAYVDRLIF
jgi:hypothetical protein